MSKRDNIASGENTKTWLSVKEFFLFTVLISIFNFISSNYRSSEMKFLLSFAIFRGWVGVGNDMTLMTIVIYICKVQKIEK